MSITPFTKDGAIDKSLLRAHLRFLSASGVGVYIAGQGSGEGDLLAVHEKIALYQIAASELHTTTQVVAAGIGLVGSTPAIRDLAVGAEAAGVGAIQVLGPRPGPIPLRADELEAYFRTIIEAVRCDVHVSNNTVLTGDELPITIVERLVEDYEHIRVINVTDPRPNVLHAYVSQIVDRLGSRVEVRVGMTASAVTAYALGARGLLSFEANVAPRLVANAWKAIENGDAAAMAPLLQLNAALARGGNPRSLKAALAIMGRDGGSLRAPFLGLMPAQYRELEQELKALALV
jgi:dihydrodipicolinate synthase/N-acetylneuraminate lyase